LAGILVLLLFGLGIFLLRVVAIGSEPAPAGFVVKARGPGAVPVVVVLALVAVNAPVSVALQAAEHHAGVAAEVVELHLETEVEVLVGLVGAQEGVGADILAESDDASVLDAVFAVAVDLRPSGQILAVEKGGEARFRG